MNPWKGLNNLPRNVWLIAGATLINRAGTMVLPFLALYLTQEMKVSASDAGLILTVYGIGSLSSAPFIGKLCDKIGSITIMKLSLLLSGSVLLLFPFVTSYYGIMLITLLLSVLAESFRPAGMAFLADQTEKSTRKTVFALNRLVINLGMSIGPVIGGFLTQIDFALLFYIDGLTSILAGIYILFVKWDVPQITHQDVNSAETKPLKSVPVFKDFNYIFFLIALMPVSIVFFQHFSTMPLFIVGELGYTKSIFGILFAVNTILIIIIEIPLNTYFANTKDWKLMSIGAVLTAIGFGAMALTSDIYLIAFSIVIWTFGEMILFPAASAYVVLISPSNRRGEYMGYYQMLFGICFVAAPLYGTNIYEFFGSTFLWASTFILGIVSAVMFAKLRSRNI